MGSASDNTHMARRTLIFITSLGRDRRRLGGTRLVLGGTMRAGRYHVCWAVPCGVLGRHHAGCWAVPYGLLGGTMRDAGRYHAGCWAVPCGVLGGTMRVLWGVWRDERGLIRRHRKSAGAGGPRRRGAWARRGSLGARWKGRKGRGVGGCWEQQPRPKPPQRPRWRGPRLPHRQPPQLLPPRESWPPRLLPPREPPLPQPPAPQPPQGGSSCPQAPRGTWPREGAGSWMGV